MPGFGAVNQPNHFYLGAAAGGHHFDGGQDLDASGVYGLRFGYQKAGDGFADSLGIEGRFDYGTTTSREDEDVNFYLARLAAIYPLVFEKRWMPFFSLGMGVLEFDDGGQAESGPLIFVGAGLEYALKGELHLRAEADSLYLLEPEDNHEIQYTLGLVYRFGKTPEKEKEKAPPPDADRDGVPDGRDRCPDTPAKVEVDERGCPVDTSDEDGDGVPDYSDKCPQTPDGVSVDEEGCPPDSDRDEIPDYLDKCPGTPEGIEVNPEGCVGGIKV